MPQAQVQWVLTLQPVFECTSAQNDISFWLREFCPDAC